MNRKWVEVRMCEYLYYFTTMSQWDTVMLSTKHWQLPMTKRLLGEDNSVLWFSLYIVPLSLHTLSNWHCAGAVQVWWAWPNNRLYIYYKTKSMNLIMRIRKWHTLIQSWLILALLLLLNHTITAVWNFSFSSISIFILLNIERGLSDCLLSQGTQVHSYKWKTSYQDFFSNIVIFFCWFSSPHHKQNSILKRKSLAQNQEPLF